MSSMLRGATDHSALMRAIIIYKFIINIPCPFFRIDSAQCLFEDSYGFGIFYIRVGLFAGNLEIQV